MKRYHVILEVFTRGQWEERPIERERRIFKFRRDAEAQAGQLRALRINDTFRYTVKRRPLK